MESSFISWLEELIQKDEPEELEVYCRQAGKKRKVLNAVLGQRKRMIIWCLEKGASRVLQFLLQQQELQLDFVDESSSQMLLEMIAGCPSKDSRLPLFELILGRWELEVNCVYPHKQELPIITAAKEAHPEVFRMLVEMLPFDLFKKTKGESAISIILEIGSVEKLKIACAWLRKYLQEEKKEKEEEETEFLPPALEKEESVLPGSLTAHQLEQYYEVITVWLDVMMREKLPPTRGRAECFSFLLTELTAPDARGAINKIKRNQMNLMQTAVLRRNKTYFKLLVLFGADPLAGGTSNCALHHLLTKEPLSDLRIEMLDILATNHWKEAQEYLLFFETTKSPGVKRHKALFLAMFDPFKRALSSVNQIKEKKELDQIKGLEAFFDELFERIMEPDED